MVEFKLPTTRKNENAERVFQDSWLSCFRLHYFSGFLALRKAMIGNSWYSWIVLPMKNIRKS